MRLLTGVLACCVVLAVSGPAGAGVMNLLDDPSLELATDNTQTSNSDWTLTVNFPDGSDPAAQFSSTVWAASDGSTGVWFKPFEGNQNPGDPPADAELSQTVAGVAQSGTYTLTFESARETNFTASAATATLSSSSGISSQLDLLTATYNDDGNMNSDPTTFTLQIMPVLAGEDLTVSVEMGDGVDALANPQSLMVDNFALTVTPFPPCDSVTVANESIGTMQTRQACRRLTGGPALEITSDLGVTLEAGEDVVLVDGVEVAASAQLKVGTCGLDLCSVTPAPALSTTCSPCVTSICAADPYCCDVEWDAQCVSEVATVCFLGCP